MNSIPKENLLLLEMGNTLLAELCLKYDSFAGERHPGNSIYGKGAHRKDLSNGRASRP